MIVFMKLIKPSKSLMVVLREACNKSVPLSFATLLQCLREINLATSSEILSAEFMESEWHERICNILCYMFRVTIRRYFID